MRSMPPAHGLGRSWAAFVCGDVVQLAEAVHPGSEDGILAECWDVAITAVVGVASLDGGVEW